MAWFLSRKSNGYDWLRIVYALWVAVFLVWFYQHEKASIYHHVDSLLEVVGQTVPFALPPHFHHAEMFEDGLSDEQDHQNRLRLSKITKNNTDLAYLYTLVPVADHLVFTSSSATTDELSTGEGLSQFGDVYFDAPEALYEVVAKQQQAFAEYSDEWGSFRSVFIPMQAEDGSFYIVGADIRMDTVQQHLLSKLYISSLTAFLVFVMPFLVVYLFKSLRFIELDDKIKQSHRELVNKEHQISSIFEHSPAGIFHYDLNSRLVTMNQSFEKIVGASRAKLLGFDMLANLTNQQMITAVRKSLAGEVSYFDGLYTSVTGNRTFYLHAEFAPLFDVDGKVSGGVAVFNDITAEKQAIEKLQASETQLKTAQEYAGIGYWELLRDGQTAYWSEQIYRILGLSEDLEPGPKLLAQVISEQDYNTYHHSITRSLKQGVEHHVEYLVTRKSDGQQRWIECKGKPVFDDDGAPIKVQGFVQDITERKQAEEVNKLAAMVFASTSEAMLVTDTDNKIIAINAAFTEMTGYQEAEVLGKNPNILSSGRQDKAFYQAMWQALEENGRWQGEIWNRRKNGEEFAEWLTINSIYSQSGELERRVALFSDITSKKEADELIWVQANYDSLTKLPNRQLFRDRLQQAMRAAQREKNRAAILYLDLDHFKEVNDTAGHHIGDLLLKQAAERIKACVRESDTVARLGGDEFIVILPELADPLEIEQVPQNIIDAVSHAFKICGEEFFVSASIGITIYPDDGVDGEDLLKQADQAMYAAKNDGRGCFRYFTASMQQLAEAKMKLSNDLRHALQRGELEVVYQPIIDLQQRVMTKAEALLRWVHPEQGAISPEVFIPIAEENGAINEIGDWVFEEVIDKLKQWKARQLPDIQISINKSPVQFLSESACHAHWHDYLEQQGLSTNCISVEITEGVLMNKDPTVSAKLLAFRDSGIQVSIDDFGTGYSSLAYLKKFDIDYLKIDKTFIDNLAQKGPDLALCEAIIVMAHKLNLKVIAEGVETEVQRELLQQIGCDFVQGYLYAKPMTAEAMFAYAAEQSENRSAKKV